MISLGLQGYVQGIEVLLPVLVVKPDTIRPLLAFPGTLVGDPQILQGDHLIP